MDAAKTKITSRRKWILGLIGFAMVWLLCGVLFAFNINLPGEMERAQSFWEFQGVDSYRYRIQLVSPWYVGGGVYITVRNGAVETIERASNLFGEPTTTPAARTPMSARPDWYIEHFSAWLPADFHDYSVDGLFSFLESKFQANPPPLIEMCHSQSRYEVVYNEARGYVEDLRFTNCPTWDVGLGLLCPTLGDCSMGFHVSEFEVLSAN